MKGYCSNCKIMVDGIAGYYYWKCPNCYNPLRLNFINRLKDEMGILR